MDKRIADVASFEREYRLRALAVVPQKAFRRQGLRAGSGDLEPFRILRTAVDFARVTRPVRTVMVTSAVRGEGKSSVAIGLAQAIALSGREVILVELDLRHPSLARTFGLADQGGVTNALLGSDPNDLLQRPLRELPDLEVLAAGVLPPNPAELLEAPALDVMLRSLLQDGKKTLVIDAAPLLPVADAQILLNKPAVDASVVVARQGVTTRDHARRARLVLEGHGAAPIGLVVTGHTARDAYGYGYGEIWQPDAPQAETHADDRSAPARTEPRPAPAPQHTAAAAGASAHASVLAALAARRVGEHVAHGLGDLRPAVSGRPLQAKLGQPAAPRACLGDRRGPCGPAAVAHLHRRGPGQLSERARAGRDDHRRAARHRLQGDDPEALVQGRQRHRLGGPVQARQGVVVGVRDPGGTGGPRGGEDALAVVARAARRAPAASRARARPPRSARPAPCAAPASRRAARTGRPGRASRAPSAARPPGRPGAKRSSTPLPITSTWSTPQRSRTSAAVASDTQMTRVAERTERGIEVRN